MKIQHSRRDFLKQCLATAGGLAAFSALAPLTRLTRAHGSGMVTRDRYYVVVYFAGGWDILVGLDPRDPAKFTNGNLNATRIQPGYDLLRSASVPTTLTPKGPGPLRATPSGIVLGPHIGDLATHDDKLCVVRGMSMETLTHDAGRRRFLTGKPPSGIQARGSSGASWLAATVGKDDPIPNLSVRVEAFNVDLPGYATALKVDSVPDLVRALRPDQPLLDDQLARQLDAFMKSAASCPAPSRSQAWQSAEGARVRARGITSAGYGKVFDFLAQTPEMDKLRGHYGINNDLTTPEAQAATAGRAIMSGVSRVSSYMAANALDTHYEDWQTQQGPGQERGFNTVARLIEDLAATEYKGSGTSWLDHTTIIGFSEFSRTAMLNDRNGRDHSLTNACFLAGAGVRGGTVVGRSSDVGMTPQAIDLTTGQPSPAGDVPRPEHVWQALFEDVGLSTEPDLRVRPLKAAFR